MNNQYEDPLSVIIITGLSGAGKSTALHIFEDLNFVTADGVPPSLMIDMIKTIRTSSEKHIKGIVLGINQHKIDIVQELEQIFQKISSKDICLTLLFLEAEISTLICRYATTRRPHPLEKEASSLEQALEAEIHRLMPIRHAADIIIDTTTYSIHDLRKILQKLLHSQQEKNPTLRVNIISFGFKYGVPKEADLLFDLRFLPNPYFIEELKDLSGTNKKVAAYVFKNQIGKLFKRRLITFLNFLLPLYEAEGRYRITIALGCTGGKHRSVATAESVARTLFQEKYIVSLEHRHMQLG